MSPPAADSVERYHGVAIALHWLIAAYVILMLAFGKYLTSLDESDPLRYVLTQWHKSFGITAMLLIAVRIGWRLGHRSPPLPEHMNAWERHLATFAHMLLYVLLVVLPLSGWVMVSTSPLELPTVLYNTVHWPHLPLGALAFREQLFASAVTIHAFAGSTLIALLAAHIGAAARHRFVLRDRVTIRMNPRLPGSTWAPGFVPTAGAIVVLSVAVNILGFSGTTSVPLVAGEDKITFAFTVQKQQVLGTFSESAVSLQMNLQAHDGHVLHADVETSTVTTGNSQIDSTLMGKDWFDTKTHPHASFASTHVELENENLVDVSGTLTIKGIGKRVQFPMILETTDNGRMARGSFTVSRLDFDLGKSSQPDDSVVAHPVVVAFEFEIR